MSIFNRLARLREDQVGVEKEIPTFLRGEWLTKVFIASQPSALKCCKSEGLAFELPPVKPVEKDHTSRINVRTTKSVKSDVQ